MSLHTYTLIPQYTYLTAAFLVKDHLLQFRAQQGKMSRFAHQCSSVAAVHTKSYGREVPEEERRRQLIADARIGNGATDVQRETTGANGTCENGERNAAVGLAERSSTGTATWAMTDPTKVMTLVDEISSRTQTVRPGAPAAPMRAEKDVNLSHDLRINGLDLHGASTDTLVKTKQEVHEFFSQFGCIHDILLPKENRDSAIIKFTDLSGPQRALSHSK